MTTTLSATSFGLDGDEIFPSHLLSLSKAQQESKNAAIQIQNYNDDDDDDGVIKKKNRRRKKKFEIPQTVVQSAQDIELSEKNENGLPVFNPKKKEKVSNKKNKSPKVHTEVNIEPKKEKLEKEVLKQPEMKELNITEYYSSPYSNTTEGNCYHRIKYCVPTPEELKIQLYNELIKESTVAKLHYDKYLLLRLIYSWDKKKMWQEMNSTKSHAQFFTANGLFLQKNPPPQEKVISNLTDTTETCFICFSSPAEDDYLEMFSPIACKHQYCVGCWINYIKHELQESKTLIKCMDPDCKAKLSYTEIGYLSQKEMNRRETVMEPGDILNTMVGLPPTQPQTIIDESPALLEIYQEKIIDSYKQIHTARLRACKAPDCDSYVCVLEYDSDNVKSAQQLKNSWLTPTVKCRNNHTFCYCCGKNNHSPFPCQLVEKWKTMEREERLKVQYMHEDAKTFEKKKKELEEKLKQENLNIDWMNNYSKKCPKCSTRIEKNGGCNHMVCTKCFYQFCWVCLSAYDIHTDMGCDRALTMAIKENHVQVGKEELAKITPIERKLLTVDNISQTLKTFHTTCLKTYKLKDYKRERDGDVFFEDVFNSLHSDTIAAFECLAWTHVLIWHLPEHMRASYVYYCQWLDKTATNLNDLLMKKNVDLNEERTTRLQSVILKVRNLIYENYVDDLQNSSVKKHIEDKAQKYLSV